MTEPLSNKNPCNDCKVDRQIGNPNRWECECDRCSKPYEWKNDCVKKLAEYETAEEEGRLVVLPCKVGDTLYAILHRRTLCTVQGREFEEYSCSGCEEEKCDSYLECFVWENKFATLEWIVGNLRKFGKTVFLTREEAEEELKKMKETR